MDSSAVGPSGSSRALRLTAGDVARAVGGRVLNGPPDAHVASFSIDTRTLKPGDLYVALRGERLDGHQFLRAAIEGGACGAIVSDPVPLAPAVLADRVLISAVDTTAALQRLARWIRRESGAHVVAITGSAGKTTTKEITAAFLGLHHSVMRSTGNLNNHIGLPLSLLALRHGAEVAVVELGMNHAGEIGLLVSIAEPNTRVWTNVAEVHSAFFDSIEGIADAKAEVLEGADADTVLVANADDPLVMARVARFPGRTLTFGAAQREGVHGATVTARAIEDLGLDGTRATLVTPAGTAEWRLPLLGRGNLMNSLAAAAVGLQFGIPLAEMAARVSSMTPAAHRGEVLRLAGGVTVVDDAYNSNPRALEAVLSVLARESRYSRRVAVLGEMLELGESSEALHSRCGRAAAAAGLSCLIAVGGPPAAALARAAARAGMPEGSVRHAEVSEEAAELAAAEVRRGDVVLVKGSRGIRTERVVERLTREFGGQVRA